MQVKCVVLLLKNVAAHRNHPAEFKWLQIENLVGKTSVGLKKRITNASYFCYWFLLLFENKFLNWCFPQVFDSFFIFKKHGWLESIESPDLTKRFVHSIFIAVIWTHYENANANAIHKKNLLVKYSELCNANNLWILRLGFTIQRSSMYRCCDMESLSVTFSCTWFSHKFLFSKGVKVRYLSWK